MCVCVCVCVCVEFFSTAHKPLLTHSSRHKTQTNRQTGRQADRELGARPSCWPLEEAHKTKQNRVMPGGRRWRGGRNRDAPESSNEAGDSGTRSEDQHAKRAKTAPSSEESAATSAVVPQDPNLNDGMFLDHDSALYVCLCLRKMWARRKREREV